VYLFNKRVQPAEVDDIKVSQCLIEIPIDMWDTLVCGVINSRDKPGYTRETFSGQLVQERSQEFYDQATQERVNEILQLIDLKRFDGGVGKKIMIKVMAYFADKYGYQILPTPKKINHPFAIGDTLSFSSPTKTGVVLVLINADDFVVKYDDGTTRVRRLGDDQGRIDLKQKVE